MNSKRTSGPPPEVGARRLLITPRKKLIEVSIPLEAINVASAREKSIRHGHPSTLHLWWARRPLAACRAVLFAQLVDDPSAWPDRFKTEEDQDIERRRLHKVIERMVTWEASNDDAILNDTQNCGFDCRHLPIDLFEALSILTLQQREGQSFSAVLGCGAILHQGLASDVKLLQFEQDLASGWARLQFQQCAHAGQNRRIQAIGLRQLASRLSETARLTRIDLDERNAGCAERAFDGAMIGPGRFEHDTV